jgi:DNA recombination protein RmuC
MDQKMTDSSRTLAQTTDNLHRTIQSQFGQSAKIITEVTEKLIKLDETNRQVISFTDQLQNLEKVLTNSKNRGSHLYCIC